jgi:hypothetical protein
VLNRLPVFLENLPVSGEKQGNHGLRLGCSRARANCRTGTQDGFLNEDSG